MKNVNKNIHVNPVDVDYVLLKKSMLNKNNKFGLLMLIKIKISFNE